MQEVQELWEEYRCSECKEYCEVEYSLDDLKSFALALVGTPYNVRDQYPEAEWYRILRTGVDGMIKYVSLQNPKTNTFIDLN